MTTDLPAPLTPPDADLRDFPFTPMFRARLFGSSFHARATDGEWRAGVTLWLKSWDQAPAGSLPDDDIDLCRLAELGRDQREWAKVRPGAMRGWVKCSDGRLYHPVVAEGVNEAWQGKLQQRWRTECSRIKKSNQRHGQNLPVPSFDEWLSSRQSRYVPEDNMTLSSGTEINVHEEIASKGKGEGEGEGEGEGNIDTADDASARLDWLEAQLRAAAGDALNSTSTGLCILDRPLAWRAAGADLDETILPVIRAVAARTRPNTIRSWKFFDQAVADAIASRMAPLPEGRTDERTGTAARPDRIAAELDGLAAASGR